MGRVNVSQPALAIPLIMEGHCLNTQARHRSILASSLGYNKLMVHLMTKYNREWYAIDQGPCFMWTFTWNNENLSVDSIMWTLTWQMNNCQVRINSNNLGPLSEYPKRWPPLNEGFGLWLLQIYDSSNNQMYRKGEQPFPRCPVSHAQASHQHSISSPRNCTLHVLSAVLSTLFTLLNNCAALCS